MLDFGFYNMDCIEGMRQFPDNYFDLAIVDPVYGDVKQGGYMAGKGGEHAAKRKNYHLALWSQDKTGPDYFKELFRVSKNQIIWGGNYFTEYLQPSQGWIVWDKKHPEGVKFADCELAYTSFNEAVRIFRYLWNGMLQENMKNKEFKIHPTQKPVALYEWLLRNYAKSDDIILDTHVGSASSLIACHNLGFKYIGFEIDTIYYENAKKRLDAEMAQLNIFEFI